MANRTQQGVNSVKGQNPQFLVDAITRNKIYSCRYWKEECMGLTAESLVDEAIKLQYVGGLYGSNQKPTRFVILILKMLQIQPDKDIIVEFMRNKDFKYVTALAMFYWRMIADQEEVYEELESLLSDYRKLRVRLNDGKFAIMYMDEFADQLLQDDLVLNIKLPHLQKRYILEEVGRLKPRVSALEEELGALDDAQNDNDQMQDEGEQAGGQGEGEGEGEAREDGAKATETQRKGEGNTASSGSDGEDGEVKKRDKSENNNKKKKKHKDKHKKRYKSRSPRSSRSRSHSHSRSRSRSSKKKHKKEKSKWRQIVNKNKAKKQD